MAITSKGDAARQALAHFAAAGDFTPAKPIGQYSDATAGRYAAQLAKGGDNLRGHETTPEHGYTKQTIGGRDIYTVHSASDAAKVIARAAKEGGRVDVVARNSATGEHQKAFENKGHGKGIDAKYLASKMPKGKGGRGKNSKLAKGIRGAAGAASGGAAGGGGPRPSDDVLEMDWAELDEFQITVYGE